MPVDYKSWIKKSGHTRPSQDERMEFVNYVLENDPKLAPIVQYDWLNIHARDEQVPYFFSEDWTTFGYIGGRGIGKSKMSNEWQKYLVFDKHRDQAIRIGVICPTQSDIERVMVMGDSGIMNVMSPEERMKCKYNVQGAKIVFDNGSVIYYYSAENSERLRGNQWHYAALDELAAYHPDKIKDILMQVTLCLRLTPPMYKDRWTGQLVGARSQKMITTTPKPQSWLRQMFRDAMIKDNIVIAQGTTYDNRANLSDTMFDSIMQYEGTALARQEIYGEILIENKDGVIKREWIRLWPSDKKLPQLKLVFGSYDPAATAKKENDPSAMVMFGVFIDDSGEYSMIILDYWTDWMEYPELREQLLIDWEKRYGDEPTNRKKPAVFIIENRSNGTAIASDISRTGVNVVKYNPGPGDDKRVRLNAVSHLIKDGRLYVAESKVDPGTVHKSYRLLVEQLCDFPLVDHDDLVDCISQGILTFMNQNLFVGQMTERDYDWDVDGMSAHASQQRLEKTQNPYIL